MLITKLDCANVDYKTSKESLPWCFSRFRHLMSPAGKTDMVKYVNLQTQPERLCAQEKDEKR